MLVLTLLGGVNAAWGQEVTYDFTGSDWSVTDGVLTNGTVSITGEGGANFKMNSGYFMFGQSGAYITLPAYDFDVEKIEVVGRSGASGSCKQNIFVGDEAVSTETTGVTGSNSYDIDANYQAAGTRYTIKVTSKHNSQITAIKIYKAGGTVVETVATPTFSPEGGIFTESQEVEISCTTDDATIYYTTDGSTPTDESDEYDGAITVSETTTIKAIAVKDGMNNSAVASATYTIKVAEPGWIDFTVQGFENEENVETITGTNGSVTFAKATGTNAPKWYDNGTAVRIYTNNTITITAEEGKKIESVEFSITSGSMIANNFNVEGDYSNSIFTLSSPANSIVYTTSSNFRLDKIKINLSSDTREEAGLSYSAEKYTATIDGQNEFPTLSNPNELAVSYESTNEDVATIDESGIVTIVAAGTTTISATSEETDTYLAGTASYTLTVTDPSAPEAGTEDNPYTVEQARAAIDAGTGVTGVYATGIVSEIVTPYSSEYGNITYNISADGTTTADQLQAYRGKSYNGENFTSEDDIQVGDVVVIYGNLKKYKDTYEFDANNQLVSLERQAQAKYYVAGDWTNWQNDMVKMTKTGASEYTLSGQTVSNGQQFKIVKVDADGKTTTWFGGDTQSQGDTYGIHSEWCTDIALTAGDAGSNFIIQSSKESTYTFTLNVENMTLTVTGWPIVLDGNAYVKITSTDELEDGIYLLVYEGNDEHASVAFNGSLESSLDANGNTIDVTAYDNRLIVANSTTNASMVTIAYDAENQGYSVQTASGIYIGTNSNSNELKTNTSTPFIHSITFDEGNALLTGSGGAVLRYNNASNQLRFRYYKSSSYSGQQPIALYKLTTVEEIPVTIGATGYATLYYSDKALAVPEGVTASTASVADKNITLADTEGFVPAGTGVVLNGEQGEYTFLVVPESTADPIEGNMLSGSDEAATTTGGGKYYMMSLDKNGENVGFYYGAAKGGAFTNGAHKAYLVVPDATAGAKSFYLFSEAETTGIGSVQSTMFNDGRMEIFNLNGQRVSTPQRGIYIVNGKKVLVK